MSSCVAVLLACNADIPIHEIATSEQLYDEWQDAFEGRELTLQVEPGLQYISHVVVGKNGHLYIPRDTANTILEFDPDGTFVRETSAESASPYLEFSLDPAGNFVFFGPGQPPGGRVTVLDPEDGRVAGGLTIRSWASAILPLTDGRLVTYSARGEADDGSVFALFDKFGRRVAAAGRIDDEALRVFHGRVQTGGVARVSVDGTLIGVHPAKFELVRMSPELDILERLIPPQGDRWAANPPPFPSDLDPFDYEPAHEKWWDSFIHIGAPFVVDDSLVLLTLWHSRGMADTANYVNLYKLPDKRLAAGLKVPRNGRVVGSGGGVVYVVRNAALQNDGSMEPLELYEYRLRVSNRNHPVTTDGN